MESNRGSRAASSNAEQQLKQLRADQRWAKLTADLPAGYDAIVGGCLVVHLLLVGLLVGLSYDQISSSLGVDHDGLFVLAMVNLLLPVTWQVTWQRAVSSSWHGTPQTEFNAPELLAAAASYLAGLTLVIATASHGRWLLTVGGALLAGTGWVLACRHWMVRYRAEVGYPAKVRLYVKFPLFVACVLLSNLVLLYVMSVLGRLVPGL